jgi:hypothetical protein
VQAVEVADGHGAAFPGPRERPQRADDLHGLKT